MTGGTKTSWNSSWSLGIAITAMCWGTLVVYYESKFGLDFPPSATGDEPDYDSIGWELANGRGFRVNSDDPDFRKPYDKAAKRDDRYRLPMGNVGLNTTRPPAYPLAISLLDRIFGRQLRATRIMDAFFVAATCGILATWVFQHFGLGMSATSVLLFIAVDVRTRLYGRAILTEAMSMFSVAVLSLALLSLLKRKKTSILKESLLAFGIGVLTGGCILIRSLMILWLPGLCLFMWWIFRKRGSSIRGSLFSVAIFLIATAMTLAPWGIRNIAVTGEMMPLGTQGLVQLSAAFSDFAWESNGLWRNLETEGFFESVVDPSQSIVEAEVARAKYSREQALNWIKEHPGKAIVLFPIKVAQEFRPRNYTDFLILILTVIGIPAAWRTPSGKLFMALIVINSFAIGMTWSVEGRFLVPLLLPIHALAIFGLASIRGILVKSSLPNPDSSFVLQT